MYDAKITGPDAGGLPDDSPCAITTILINEAARLTLTSHKNGPRWERLDHYSELDASITSFEVAEFQQGPELRLRVFKDGVGHDIHNEDILAAMLMWEHRNDGPVKLAGPPAPTADTPDGENGPETGPCGPEEVINLDVPLIIEQAEALFHNILPCVVKADGDDPDDSVVMDEAQDAAIMLLQGYKNVHRALAELVRATCDSALVSNTIYDAKENDSVTITRIRQAISDAERVLGY
jgi:hypothetical protein